MSGGARTEGEGSWARWVSRGIIGVALLGVACLVLLPLMAGRAADRLQLERPAALPELRRGPAPLQKPVVPVEELREELELPRVDPSPTDGHARASLEAHRAGDRKRAFEEAVLSLDPAPLADNALYRAITTTGVDAERIEKDGRQALVAVDEALRPVLGGGDPETTARLSNAAAMTILYYGSLEPRASPRDDPGLAAPAEELAYQAADLDPSYCPALLNLTLLNGMVNPFGSEPEPAGLSLAGDETWADRYPEGGCEEPALLYHAAQASVRDGVLEDDPARTLELADRLGKDPRWAGLARSVKGDAYYWHGVFALERARELSGAPPRPFTARRYLRLALEEYDAALALQPDDAALHNGRALAHLALAGDGGNGAAGEAAREAEAALAASGASMRARTTLLGALEAAGDYGEASRLGRAFVSDAMPEDPEAGLVPYTPVSHGSDLYRELRVTPPGAGAGVALLDEEVIAPYEERNFLPEGFDPSVPRGLDQARTERLRHDLLRDDLLADDPAFYEDLEETPSSVRENERTLLLVAARKMLDPPQVASAEGKRDAINAFLASAQKGLAYASEKPGLPPPEGDDLFYREAGNLFRQHGQPDRAALFYETWSVALKGDGAQPERLAEAANLRGEALYLAEEKEEALAAFDEAVRLRPDWPPYAVRRAFVYEKLGEYETAERLYGGALKAMREPVAWMDPLALQYNRPEELYAPDNYQAAKHLGDVLMLRVQEEAVPGDEKETASAYAKAAAAYRDAEAQSGPGDLATAAVANRGVALLLSGDRAGAVGAFRRLVRPPETGFDGSAVAYDEHNPLFRLNLGWAHELKGEPEEAAEQYLAAVRSDPTFYPALNDLGVLAAKEGRTDEAKGYFRAALDAKPDYDRALFNLGVALLRDGPRGFLAGQGYLARAVEANPPLSEAGYDYVSDNDVYFLDMSLVESVPPDWRFAAHAEGSAVGMSLVALALLGWRVLYGFAGSELWESAVVRGLGFLGRIGARFGGRLGTLPARFLPGSLRRLRNGTVAFMRLGLPTSGTPWTTAAALAVSAPAVTLVVGWSLVWGDSGGKLIMLATLLCLVVVSLLVHHAGHAAVALRFGVRLHEAPWPMGIAQAVALIAIGGPAVAPMPVGIAEGVEGRKRAMVFLAGPLASLSFAMLLLALYLAGSVPLLRLGATLNLSLAAVSLISLPPLDAAMVGEGRHTRWLVAAGVVLAVLAVLVSLSNQLYCLQTPGGSCWDLYAEPG